MKTEAQHEFAEDLHDYSMCMCGVSATEHWRVEPATSEAAR